MTKSSKQYSFRLFCFPYAGGGTLIFRNWQERLAPHIEVCPIQLPGRGNRLREDLLTNIVDFAEYSASQVQPLLDKPFAFFGHSMGALISFELARYLRKHNGIEPMHLFASGCRAPQIPDPDPPTYDLAESEFCRKLVRLNGTPKELLDNADLMQMMIPLLRADFEAAETYCCGDGPKLNCPISTYGGLQDLEVKREYLNSWSEQTTGRFTLRMFEGDHFFIHKCEPLLLYTIGRELVQLQETWAVTPAVGSRVHV
jgi:medium-chain acyl-[acyl-carrier-protein] hydrolase